MSSSRSIAAARQRRAGEAPPVGQQRGPGTSINSQQAFAQQQMQQNNPNQLPPQAPQVPVGKLSVGDAFALVTIRLGRVESIIQKLEAEGVIGPNAQSSQNSGSVMEHDENMRLVDDTVIRNIIARLGDLEKGQTKLSNQPKVESGLNADDVSKAITQRTNDLNHQITLLKDELRDTKEMLMKLQSFSMETNQKIISIVLTQEKQETFFKTAPNEEIFEEESSEENGVNLKQIIENELSKVNVDENEDEEEEEEEENISGII
jgi:hypothetical protein